VQWVVGFFISQAFINVIIITPCRMNFKNRISLRSSPIVYLLCIGFLLRLWNIDWSLPEVYEEAYPLTVSWKFWNWSDPGIDLNPHFFNYPALIFYLNFLIQVVHYIVGHIFGSFPTLNQFQSAYSSDPSSFVIMGRGIGILFDLGTIYIAYRFSERLGGKLSAVIAGIFLAVNPLQIKEAHLINVDTPLMYFIILSLYFLQRFLTDRNEKWCTYFGISAGLAIGTKYTGSIVLIVFLFLFLQSWFGERKGTSPIKFISLLTVIVLSGVTFFVVNPYSMINFKEFYADLSFKRFHASYGHLGLDSSQSSFSFYLTEVLPASFGLPIVVLIVVKIVHDILSRQYRSLLLILFSVLYLLAASFGINAYTLSS